MKANKLNLKTKNKVAAIYTTYKPDEMFEKRVESIECQVDLVIVVDNTPLGHKFEPQFENKFIILRDGLNKGLGRAINIGIEKAKYNGCEGVILFDQDSTPSESMINSLFDILNEKGEKFIVGPKLIDDKKNTTADLIKVDVQQELQRKTCIPTSGMAFKLSALPSNIVFSEDLFLDFVDFEWCWRLRKIGWCICQANNIQMRHRLGLSQNKLIGLTYHVPTPVRHYFQFRDGLRLILMKHVPIYSKIRYTFILIPKIFIYPLILNNGLSRLKWMLLGIRDFLLNVKGIGAGANALR